MRIPRILALGASLLVLLGACSTGGGSSGSPGLAKLKLGVATDCATNPVCGQALKTAYNIDVTNATQLAACSTPMAQALLGKTIDVAELCSTQPDIAVNGWVVLDDDKHTQPADNIARSCETTTFPSCRTGWASRRSSTTSRQRWTRQPSRT